MNITKALKAGSFEKVLQSGKIPLFVLPVVLFCILLVSFLVYKFIFTRSKTSEKNTSNIQASISELKLDFATLEKETKEAQELISQDIDENVFSLEE